MTGPLAGLKVLDLGTRIAAPFCAGLLGEQGAEVVKIEQPGTGDFMREIGPFVDGYSMFWAVEGRGRKSVTIDLRTTDGRDVLRRLAAEADVLCENFRPGTLERWGLAPADLDPRLVMVRISAFGQDGPYSARPGLDRLGIGYGGLLNLTGYPDRPPVRPGVTTSDYLTGVFAAQAALAALYRRDADRPRPAAARSSTPLCTARSCASSSGLLRCTTRPVSSVNVKATGWPTPHRSTTIRPLTGDTSAWLRAATPTTRGCARRWTVRISCPIPGSRAWRTGRRDQMRSTASSPSGRPPFRRPRSKSGLVAHDVPVATAYTAADICDDAHMTARGDLVSVADPVVGAGTPAGPVPAFRGRAGAGTDGAPRLGEHTREVLADWLGLTETNIDALAKSGVTQ